MSENKRSLENPAEGVTVDSSGRQKVNWDGVKPESDNPDLDGHTDGGFPVGH
jgi:hypothetical protein